MDVRQLKRTSCQAGEPPVGGPASLFRSQFQMGQIIQNQNCEEATVSCASKGFSSHREPRERSETCVASQERRVRPCQGVLSNSGVPTPAPVPGCLQIFLARQP